MSRQAVVEGGISLNKEIERVFVGVPDVFSVEQSARVQAMYFAEKMQTFRIYAGEDEAPTVEQKASAHIDLADKFAQYILNGRKP